MLPFFPSLKPSVVNSIWFDIDAPCEDESEVNELEKEHKDWVLSINSTAVDLNPIGKVQPIVGPDTDEEDAIDDSEDSDSHDNDEDEDEMEGNDNNQQTVDRDRMET